MKTFIAMGLDGKECGVVRKKNAKAALKAARAAIHEKATIRVATEAEARARSKDKELQPDTALEQADDDGDGGDADGSNNE